MGGAFKIESCTKFTILNCEFQNVTSFETSGIFFATRNEEINIISSSFDKMTLSSGYGAVGGVEFTDRVNI